VHGNGIPMGMGIPWDSSLWPADFPCPAHDQQLTGDHSRG